MASIVSLAVDLNDPTKAFPQAFAPIDALIYRIVLTADYAAIAAGAAHCQVYITSDQGTQEFVRWDFLAPAAFGSSFTPGPVVDYGPEGVVLPAGESLSGGWTTRLDPGSILNAVCVYSLSPT